MFEMELDRSVCVKRVGKSGIGDKDPGNEESATLLK